MSRIHNLKSQPPYFDAIASGIKAWDMRIDDVGYQAGDVLVLDEYDPERGDVHHLKGEGRRRVDCHYTGRAIRVIVERVWCLSDMPEGVVRRFDVQGSDRVGNRLNGWVILDIRLLATPIAHMESVTL